MADTLKNAKESSTRPLESGRFVLRAVLAIMFVGFTVMLVVQGLSAKQVFAWLVYLGLFIATDQIANAILNRLARQEEKGTTPLKGQSNS